MKAIIFIVLFSGNFLLANEESFEEILMSDCSIPIALNQKIFSYIENPAFLFNDDIPKKKLSFIPETLLNWSSNGLEGAPWIFKNNLYNNFFEKLFLTIGQNINEIKLTPHDLFHAHIILFNQIAKKDGLVLIFHAKEYPIDLAFNKNYYQDNNEIFWSTDISFQDRNIIYYSGFKNNLFLVENFGICSQLFNDYLINTIDEKIVENKLTSGANVGDVNLFLKRNINRIKYNFNDEESLQSKKTQEERVIINTQLDQWLLEQPKDIILFFLTGKPIG